MGSSVKWLWDHIESKYRKLLVLALILCAFTNILLLINPTLIQRLVDEVILAQNRVPLLPLVGIMMGVKVGREILRYFMIITRQFSKRVRPRFIAMRERLSEMNTVAQENIAGNRVVRAFARENCEKQRFITCSSKIIDIQNSKPLIVDAPDAEAHPRMEGRIEFKHVTFRMENKTIIDDVSFVAEPGQPWRSWAPPAAEKPR